MRNGNCIGKGPLCHLFEVASEWMGGGDGFGQSGSGLEWSAEWQSGNPIVCYSEARRRAFVCGHNGGRPGESVKNRVNSIKGFERITEHSNRSGLGPLI